VSRVESIGEILHQVVRDLGVGKKLNEQRAVVEWRDVVGDRVAAHSRATRVDQGRLFVEVDSSVWAQELSLMRRRILQELGNRIGRGVIETVHFVLGGTTTDGSSCPHFREDRQDGKD
jgi:predicted nucleic acid-binding Zn ribbon protein